MSKGGKDDHQGSDSRCAVGGQVRKERIDAEGFQEEQGP
jgi:hypothetical protein